MFWLYRHLLAKQALNSKQSTKGYERIIREILRRSGYFNNTLFQVPGRMGLLVTLHLISSNVYNSLNAPQKRGFSYIEVWMIGAQGVILMALLEYGFILAWKKYLSTNTVNPSKITATLVSTTTPVAPISAPLGKEHFF